MIDRQLVQGLINPAFGQQMSEDLRRMAERNRKQKMLKPLFEAEGMFTKASEIGDADLAAQQGAKLMQAGQEAGNADMFKRGQEMRSQSGTIRASTAASQINNIRKALKNPALNPQAKEALEERQAKILQTPGVGAILQKQRDALFKQIEQNDKMATIQRGQQERGALGGLVGGMSATEVQEKYGLEAYASVQKDWAQYQENLRKANEEASKPTFSREMATYKALPQASKNLVDSAKETTGDKAALQVMRNQYAEMMKSGLQKEQTAREGARSVDAETYATKLLSVSETGGWFNWSEDVGEWYSDQDEDTREDIKDQVKELYKQARLEHHDLQMPGEPQDYINQRVEEYLSILGAPVGEAAPAPARKVGSRQARKQAETRDRLDGMSDGQTSGKPTLKWDALP
jgi:guanyl-specific ribonuclease Sa